jgi:chromosome segregation ATPase
MDATELTIEQRYELINKLIDTVEVITKELEASKNQATLTASTIGTYTTLWGESVKNYEDLRRKIDESVEAIEKQVADYKEETDRLKQYSKGIDDNLEARLTIFKERFENLNRTIEILDRQMRVDLNAMRMDLNWINERIKELPNLEIIRNELSNSTSPLVTKNDFNALEQKIANIEGAVNSHFRNNIVGLVAVLATIISTNVLAYYTFVAKIDSLKQPVTSQTSPSPPKPSP